MCVCVCLLTLNCKLEWEAVCFVQGPVSHHAADVSPVVLWFGDHAVLAAHGHSVVATYLRHRGGVAVGCGHPFDLRRRATVDGITTRHNDLAGSSFHRHNGGRILRLSWWMKRKRQKGD